MTSSSRALAAGSLSAPAAWAALRLAETCLRRAAFSAARSVVPPASVIALSTVTGSARGTSYRFGFFTAPPTKIRIFSIAGM